MVHADTKTWNFVTGDKTQLYNLARKGYLLNIPEGESSLDKIHLETFILVDKEKHIRGIYNGTNIKAVSNLIDDVKVLMAEYLIRENAKKPASNLGIVTLVR
jgi:protein SCO1/2